MNAKPKQEPVELSETSREFLRAAYNGDIETARLCLERDPSCVNAQDPAFGLTALHMAIFRQDTELVKLITTRPELKSGIKDCFNRSFTDMLVYTTDREIFHIVTKVWGRDEFGQSKIEL